LINRKRLNLPDIFIRKTHWKEKMFVKMSKLCCLIVSLTFLILFSAFGFGQEKTVLRWRDVREFGIEGKGWTDTKDFYDRLPAKAESLVRPAVWKLAQNSAGTSVRFSSDTDSISVRWKLRSSNLALPNMAAIGASGVDLYVKDEGVWRWLAVGKAEKFPINEQKLIAKLKQMMREYLLYFPLYNGVEAVEIGLPENALIQKAPAREKRKPIVFYGTSIVQGASASRAGMAYPSILSRRHNRAAINLGFSGNGKMEAEMAELIGELDAAIFVIDCLPNLGTGEEVREKAAKFIEILRWKNPRSPIVLVENLFYPDAVFDETKRAKYQEKNVALRRVYQKLIAAGAKNIYYVRGENLVGADGEATIDGVHPTDLGFMRMADALGPVLKKAMRDSRPQLQRSKASLFMKR
jgi:lysophospholipase L1-like esterase